MAFKPVVVLVAETVVDAVAAAVEAAMAPECR
jgi:hypothetical protein